MVKFLNGELGRWVDLDEQINQEKAREAERMRPYEGVGEL